MFSLKPLHACVQLQVVEIVVIALGQEKLGSVAGHISRGTLLMYLNVRLMRFKNSVYDRYITSWSMHTQHG